MCIERGVDNARQAQAALNGVVCQIGGVLDLQWKSRFESAGKVVWCLVPCEIRTGMLRGLKFFAQSRQLFRRGNALRGAQPCEQQRARSME